MKIIVCKDDKDWIEKINSWLGNQASVMDSWSLFIPAGDTPRPLYRSWEMNHPQFLARCKLMQVDDVISGESQGIFKKFFNQVLPHFSNQMLFIDTAEFVADVALLGLGLNGHVAFHEPFLSPSFYSGCLQLDRVTTDRLKINPKAHAVSYGLGAFMRAQAVALIVRGHGKKQILQQILSKDSHLPAAQLKKHANFSIFTDFEVS